MKTTSKTLLTLNRFSRRKVIGLALAAAAFAPLSAQAASKKQAEALILTVVDQVQAVINSGKSETAMIQNFEQIFANYANVQAIARSVLGPTWRSASSAEQKAYVKAFQSYVSRKYGRQFHGFEDAKIQVSGSKDFGKKGIIVQSVVTTSKFAPFPVEWHVVDQGGTPKFFDLYVEGVKLISTEREEVRAVLEKNGGSVAKLAQALNSLG